LFGGIEASFFARAEALVDITIASQITKQESSASLYSSMAAAAAASNHQHHHHGLLPSHYSPIARHVDNMSGSGGGGGVGGSGGSGANASSNTSGSSEHDRNANSTFSPYHNHHHLHHHHNLHQTNNMPSLVLPDTNANPFYNAFYHHSSLSPSGHSMNQHSSMAIAAAAAAAAQQQQQQHGEVEIDPRELETFAERFKQRRIKLGVTQADVGQQLSKLKLPGVGSLSQSKCMQKPFIRPVELNFLFLFQIKQKKTGTICRFESLTLSHNNMIALKPILHSWLEQAEADVRSKRKNEEVMSTSSVTNSVSSTSTSTMSTASNHERKRKRTSIAAPEKRSLEAFFAVQPRPSGEKIAQIADKLDLKKNVVRVWFCNQRQKQKRMKFNSIPGR